MQFFLQYAFFILLVTYVRAMKKMMKMKTPSKKQNDIVYNDERNEQ